MSRDVVGSMRMRCVSDMFDIGRHSFEKLTTCAKTRCKNTLITSSFIGKTAWMIWASWSTVDRISFDSAVSPGSAVGAGLFESFRAVQLAEKAKTKYPSIQIAAVLTHISSTGTASARGVPSGFRPEASSKTLSLEMKKSCWLTYICMHDVQLLKSCNILAQC